MNKQWPALILAHILPNTSIDLLVIYRVAMAEPVTLENGNKSPMFEASDSEGNNHNLNDLLEG